jgi:hypothetical protein
MLEQRNVGLTALLAAFFVISFGINGCSGGDYEAATLETQFTPEAEPQLVPENRAATDELNTRTEPDPIDRVTDPEPQDDPKKDPDDSKDPTEEEEYDPDWTKNDDPAVEGCLEIFPAICNEINECGEEMPVLKLIGGFCPTLFDAVNPLLTLGCDELTGVLEDQLGGGLGGGALGPIITKLLKGCIENFNCDPEYLQKLGEAFAPLLQLLGGAQGGGGGDIASALPQLLKLAEMCGGIGNLLPF